jgi:P4 family phage/plasmid primase-like protien
MFPSPLPLQPCKNCRQNIGSDSTGLCGTCDSTHLLGKAVSKKTPKKVEMPPPAETLAETLTPADPATPEPFVVITTGLATSDKACEDVPLSKLKAYLETHRECYERTMPTERDATRTLNRLYVDCDGELPSETSEVVFGMKVKAITDTLKAYCEKEKLSLMESCKWKCADDKGNTTNKLSYRITDPFRVGTKSAIKHEVSRNVIPKLTTLLQDLIPVVSILKKKKGDDLTGRLVIDLSVYNDGNRKMRMWNSSKPLQKRHNKLVVGTLEDSLITYIGDAYEMLETPQSILTLAPAPIKDNLPVEDEATSVAETTTDVSDPSQEDVSNKELIAEVLKGLGSHRWDYYPDWLRIGFVLFNEGFSVEEFVEFSRVSKHFQTDSPRWIRLKWKKFRKSNLTQALLWKWLGEDDADLYTDLSERRMDFWNLTRTANHAETARFFYNLKPDAYAFNEKIGWFQLQPSSLWKKYEKTPSGLISDIWRTFKPIIKEHQNRLNLTETDEDKAKLEKEKLVRLLKFGQAIGNHSFVNGVVAFLPSCYNDDELDKKMDESRHLIAFSDAVYDLDKSEVREIRPDDWCSINTGYPYPRKRFPEAREEMIDVIRSCFETEEMIETAPTLSAMTLYLLKTIATCLHGTKKWEQFYVWTGSGGNGKGLISDLVKRALGDYYHTIPNSCITKSQDKKDAPNPPIAKSKGKRFVQASEPEADSHLQVGCIKEYSGGDEITARDLYASTITFKPQFGLFLQTNSIPKLNRPDGGVQRRLRVITFPFQFVADPTEPHHKAINCDLKDKIVKTPEWRDEMFHLLLECYEDIKQNGIKEPKEVLDASQEYMDDNNPVKSWLNQKYETKDPNSRKYQLESSLLKKQYEEDTGHDISADRFKACMLLCGVSLKKEGHNFTIKVPQKVKSSDGSWKTEEREVLKKAGKYWCGLQRFSEDASGTSQIEDDE